MSLLTWFLASVVAFLTLYAFYKPFRFYILSFGFDYLYKHPKAAAFFGIGYKDDRDWVTDRDETYIYTSGFFIEMFKLFSGMGIVLPDKVRKDLLRVQGEKAKGIDMRHYFHDINEKKLTIEEFEDFLSKSILIETNRAFGIVDNEVEKEMIQLLVVLRGIVTVLRGDFITGISVFFRNIGNVFRLSSIIRSLPGHLRFLVFVPQLALLDNFTKAILNRKGDMAGLEENDFLIAVAQFSIFHTGGSDGQLVFMHRNRDLVNNANNKAFGPTGVQCPGNIYTFNFIRSILDFLKAMQIKVEGTPIWVGGRFKYINNKQDVSFTFNSR
jgi:hypothetical protein